MLATRSHTAHHNRTMALNARTCKAPQNDYAGMFTKRARAMTVMTSAQKSRNLRSAIDDVISARGAFVIHANMIW